MTPAFTFQRLPYRKSQPQHNYYQSGKTGKASALKSNILQLVRDDI